jgi:coiled-coil domain-containing protein 6
MIKVYVHHNPLAYIATSGNTTYVPPSSSGCTNVFTIPSPIHSRTSSFGSNPQLQHIQPSQRKRTNSTESSSKGRDRPTTR